MLLKTLIKSNKINVFKIIPVRSSALFINRANATENYVFLVPHVDFQRLSQERNVLENMITKRKSKFNLNKLENLSTVYDELKHLKVQQENKKSELSKELIELLKLKKETNDIDKLKMQIKLIKENINNLKIPLWCAEEAAMVEALKLPNLLHKFTPDNNNNVIFEHKTPSNNNKDHCIIGKDKNLIKYRNSSTIYLLGDAALFELGAKFFFSSFLKQNNFIQFSNTDFVRSLVVEGCGVDHTNPSSTFILHHNDNYAVNKDKRLHLTGAGSLFSFLAYHAKNVIYSKVLPLKYFSLGQQYTPSTNPDKMSLFDASQSSVVEIFVAAQDSDALDKLLEEILGIVKTLFNQLNYHYRLCYVSADKLYMWESLRVSIEMYSASLTKYIEVGHISLSRDFITKRLMFKYTDNKESKFPHILSGTILNVPKILGCILEQDEEFSIPDAFHIENWIYKNNVETINV